MLLAGAAYIEDRAALYIVPHSERMFQDMIGPMDKLPTLTQWVMQLSRFQATNVIFIFLGLLLVLAVLWWRRGAAWICVVCVMLTVLFAGLAAIDYFAILTPYARIMSMVGGS